MKSSFNTLPEDRRHAAEVAMQFVRGQGAILGSYPNARERLQYVIDELGRIFPEMEQVAAFYLYEQSKQTAATWASSDAICSIDADTPGGPYCAIGVSLEGLAQGHAYAAFLVMHELAHWKTPDTWEHSAQYHDTLNRLLDRFAKKTGIVLPNDWTGMQIRHDSMPIPDYWFDVPKAPQQPIGENATFHTESL